jgi:hypothetical protein
VVLKKAYNKKHRSQVFNSTCNVASWVNVTLMYSIYNHVVKFN